MHLDARIPVCHWDFRREYQAIPGTHVSAGGYHARTLRHAPTARPHRRHALQSPVTRERCGVGTSGAAKLFDFECFLIAYKPSLDRDGELTIFNFQAIQTAFAAGCE